MNSILFRTMVSAALLGMAGPAFAAKSFSAVVECGGSFAPGDDVPFSVTVTDLDGKVDNTLFVTITLDVPGSYNNQLVASGVLRLEPGQVRVLDRVEHLPLKAPPGSYSMFLNASSENGTDITVCDFVVN